MKSNFFGKERMEEIGKQEVLAFDTLYKSLGLVVEVHDGKPKVVRMEEENEG